VLRQSEFEQLSLPLRHDKDYLKDYFQRATGENISMAITDNSVSMLSVTRKGNLLSLRLHRMFLEAGGDILNEIAEFMKRRKGKTPLLRKFVRQNSNCLPMRTPRKTRLNTEGKHFDLQAIYDSLNHDYFGGRISCCITWGVRSPRYAVKRRTVGSYSSQTNTIRVTPLLDKRTIPRYFIEFVVYHEMLHADMDTPKKNARRLVHSKEFRRREKVYEQYEKAVAWERGRKF
jgi:predicted metal-dependent hydrolase